LSAGGAGSKTRAAGLRPRQRKAGILRAFPRLTKAVICAMLKKSTVKQIWIYRAKVFMIERISKNRFLFKELDKRDFKKKYKRTTLGILWSMLLRQCSYISVSNQL
jgi:hypothetical protein